MLPLLPKRMLSPRDYEDDLDTVRVASPEEDDALPSPADEPARDDDLKAIVRAVNDE